MLSYTVSSNSLVERDIYAIEPVASLQQFLLPQRSLIIVKAPFLGTIVEMTRVMGKDRDGNLLRVYLDTEKAPLTGYTKSKLDRSLLSPYLFVSWKQRTGHTFRIFERRQVVAEFPDFDSALAAYFPRGFIPENSYRRQHSVFTLMCMSMRRRRSLRELVTVLARRSARLGGE